MNTELKTYEDLTLDQNDDFNYKHSINCCRLVLRVTPQVSPHFPRTLKKGRRYIDGNSFNEFANMFSTNIVDTFDTHFIKPLKLKQNCRLMIRKILNEKWLLPLGLYNLNIPHYLKLYLDLYYD